MDNSEEVLENLIEYDKNPTATIPTILETYLEHIAKTGYTRFPWFRIKTLFKVKLENVIADFSGASPVENVPIMPNVEEFKYEEMKTRIFEQLESYSGVPFTIQRICELITQPYDYYKRIDKFMRGLERVMLVVTITDPNPAPAGSGQNFANGFSSTDMPASACELHRTMVLDNNLGKKSEEAGSSKLLGREDDMGGSLRRAGDALESPAKRMRLSVEEDGGPCDSADQVPPPIKNGSPPGNECMESASLVSSHGVDGMTNGSTASSQSSSPATSSSATCMTASLPSTSAASMAAAATNGSAAQSEQQGADSSPTDADDQMEIDIECTSSYRMESNPESSPKQETREAMPDMKEGPPADISLDNVDSHEVINNRPIAIQNEDMAVGGGSVADHQVDEHALLTTNGGAEEAEEGISTSDERGPQQHNDAPKSVLRGPEEGISTSGESGQAELAVPQQVETNSEAEASSEADKAEELPSEERMASEAQEIVVSSEATVEPRVEEMAGAADSSDQVESPHQQPCEVEGAPDQSECPAESIQQNQQVGEAIEESAEAASASPVEQSAAVTVQVQEPPAAAETSNQSVAIAASEEAAAAPISAEAVAAEVVATGASDGGAAADDNEAVECAATEEQKNDSPDQSV